MTYEMEYTAYLYACGARGTTAQPPLKPVDWDRVVQLSVEQSITYTVAMAIKKSDPGCPEEIRSRLISSLRGAAIKNSIKTDGILALVEKMERSGIRVVVLKGLDVARFYANPECRVSSDTDLLIAPEDEERAVEFLTSQGFVMKERDEDSNHAVGNHPALGMVELHVQLLPDFYNKASFGHWQLDSTAMQNRVAVSLRDKTYYALEPTENMLFLTHHMIKHLLVGGISLRMMMDNALFAVRGRGTIDAEAYSAALRETKYFYTMQLIFGVMTRYCGFSREDFPIEPREDAENMAALLDDLEKGGWQGKNNEHERSEAWFYYRYRNALYAGDRETLSDIRSDGAREFRSILFPPMEHMRTKYPSLNRRAWLYPFCCAHRILTRGTSRLASGTKITTRRFEKEENLSPAALERAELFEKLELL